MYLLNSRIVRQDFPDLVTEGLLADDVTPTGNLSPWDMIWAAHVADMASARLADETEGAFTGIQAWRKALGRMGLKPPRYEFACEAPTRRLRTGMPFAVSEAAPETAREHVSGRGAAFTPTAAQTWPFARITEGASQ